MSWDVLQEEGVDHFSSALTREGRGRNAEADQWRQVELGMGWP